MSEPTTHGWVTMTIRLTPAEAEEVSAIVKRRADTKKVNMSRQTILRQWVLAGIAEANRQR